MTFKYVIIGAGPAGLSARYGLHILNEKNYLLIDGGPSLGQRVIDNDRSHIGGIGGAALFSDGHFVFYPAGNKLWSLDEDLLRISYKQLDRMFHGILNIPSLPSDLRSNETANDKHKQKEKSAFHLTIEQRISLFEVMLEGIQPHQLSLNTKLCRIELIDNNQYILHCMKNDAAIEFRCENLILSGGRFFPMLTQTFPLIEHVYKQVDVGVRICGPADDELFSFTTQANSKVIPSHDENLEYRTFFWCRNGKCLFAKQDGISAFYGHTECHPTLESNFGFNLSFKTADGVYFLEIAKAISPFELSVNDIEKLSSVYGLLGTYIAGGINTFLANVKKDALNDGNMYKLRGPTIEAVGHYPLLENNLKVSGKNIWFIGDATGIFRGIVPGMLSGLFAINQLKSTH